MEEELGYFSCAIPYALCAILSFIFVGSFYVWKSEFKQSYHPTVLKSRCIRVICVTLLSPWYVMLFVDSSLLEKATLWRLLGLRTDGIIAATLLPLCLTLILFAGPLFTEYVSGVWVIYLEPKYIRATTLELMWIRNQIVAPITEEFVFRACMLSLMIHCTDPVKAIFICPIFFGAAHIHHMLDNLKLGIRLKVALLWTGFQFCFTTIFGAYSSYLFLKTGHLIAPILVHSFCNLMGFPNMAALSRMKRNEKILCVIFYILGLVSWCLLLDPLTHPSYFHNDLPWKDAFL